MIVPIVQNLWYEPQLEVAPVVQLVVFNIGAISCGISIDKIHQVISDSRDLNYLDHIEILDLHEQILGTSSFDTIDEFAYWLIVKSLNQQFYGIPIELVPTFSSISLDQIRVIPADLRAGTPLRMATHVGMIADATGELMVFILEL